MATDPAVPPPDTNSPFSKPEGAPHTSTFHTSHLSIRHRITFDLALSSPALVQEGVLSGYFEDRATCELLVLEDADILLCSGTYSDREPGRASIEFSLLSEGSYDQHLLLFVPQNHTSYHHLDLHKLNRQAYPYAGSLDALNSHLRDALREAQELGTQVDLNLPDYV